MRVLIIPELYRPDDASANATLNDACTWVKGWLDLDDRMHAYWLLPPRKAANYDAEYVHADRDRVTLIEARSFMSDRRHETAFTESGYTEEQLLALKEAIYDRLGYVDVVIDQLRRGRADLVKWLLLQAGHDTERPEPFSVITNVHDLLLPWKYPDSSHRNAYQRRTEVANAVLSDGIWFKARIDADGMRTYAREFLRDSTVDRALERAVQTDSPIDFSQFEEIYREEPRWFHIAGSTWEKKHPELLVDISKTLYNRFGIRTVMTSMGDIPETYAKKPWIDAYPRASRETYYEMLERGDIAVCATEYDTLARTWFEQAASGQVLVLRDERWIYDCVPTDHDLVAPVEDLAEKVIWAVEHWDEAVAANRRLVEHVRKTRSPEMTARRTHKDMVNRVTERIDRYEGYAHPLVEQTVERIARDEVSLRDLDEEGAALTEDGQRLLEREDCEITDLVFTLRRLGFVDTGNPGTPTFVTE